MAKYKTKEKVLNRILNTGHFSQQDKQEKERSLLVNLDETWSSLWNYNHEENVYLVYRTFVTDRPRAVFDVPEIDKVETVGQLVNFVCKCLGINDGYPDNMVNPGFIPTPSHTEINLENTRGGVLRFPVKLRVEPDSVTMAYKRYYFCEHGDLEWEEPAEVYYYNVVRKGGICVPNDIKSLFRAYPSLERLDIEWEEHTLNIKVWIVANGKISECFCFESPWSFRRVECWYGSNIANIGGGILNIVSENGIDLEKPSVKQLFESVGLNTESERQRRKQERLKREQERLKREQENEPKKERKRYKGVLWRILMVSPVLVFFSVAFHNNYKAKKYQNAQIVKQQIVKQQIASNDTISY